MAGSPVLDDLDAQQRNAVLAPIGPVLVLGGPGTGKTRVLAWRVAHLVRDLGVSPYSILAVSFTNKAANDMKGRIANAVGSVADGMWVSTFHSACVRILRREAPRLGYRSSFTIYGKTDSLRLVSSCIGELGLNPEQFVTGSVHSAIATAKDELVGHGEYETAGDGFYHENVARVYRRYQQRLFDASAIDLDDILMLTADIFRAFPEVLAQYQQLFQHLLIDDHQDTNHAQYTVARLLAGAHRNIFIVGDPDQAVYAFRGSDMRNILDFEKEYGDGTVVMLERNYRSTKTILDAANAVISNNEARRPARLWTSDAEGEPIATFEAKDELDEAAFIADRIRSLETDGVALSEVAVFYRTNAQSRVIEEVFVRYGVPYQVVGGLEYYDRREVKDAIAYLRVIVNPDDQSVLKRIINVPKRAIGDTSIGHVEVFADSEGIGFLAALRRADENPRLTKRARGAIKEFVALIDDLAERATDGPVAAIDAVLRQTGYLEMIRSDRSIEAMGKEENLRELAAAVAEFEEVGPSAVGHTEWATLGGVERLGVFVEAISLVEDMDAFEDRELVTLMTLHNAKGLEFPVVFITGVEEGLIPMIGSTRRRGSIEEERSLFYVGMTRAEQRLHLTRAWSRTLWGQTRHNDPSRFLSEIPKPLVTSAPRVRPSDDQPTMPPQPSVNVDEIRIGDRVRHTHWDEGVVTEIVGRGEATQVTVAFEGVGEKRLLLAWAPLERIAD